jgi:hypothetical protein
VAKFLANISSLTKPEATQTLAHLSADEEARLELLEKSLLDVQTNDPEKLIHQLTAPSELQADINALADWATTIKNDETEESVSS